MIIREYIASVALICCLILATCSEVDENRGNTTMEMDGLNENKGDMAMVIDKDLSFLENIDEINIVPIKSSSSQYFIYDVQKVIYERQKIYMLSNIGDATQAIQVFKLDGTLIHQLSSKPSERQDFTVANDFLVTKSGGVVFYDHYTGNLQILDESLKLVESHKIDLPGLLIDMAWHDLSIRQEIAIKCEGEDAILPFFIDLENPGNPQTYSFDTQPLVHPYFPVLFVSHFGYDDGGNIFYCGDLHGNLYELSGNNEFSVKHKLSLPDDLWLSSDEIQQFISTPIESLVDFLNKVSKGNRLSQFSTIESTQIGNFVLPGYNIIFFSNLYQDSSVSTYKFSLTYDDLESVMFRRFHGSTDSDEAIFIINPEELAAGLSNADQKTRSTIESKLVGEYNALEQVKGDDVNVVIVTVKF